MNRQLKFRIWDTLAKHYVYPEDKFAAAHYWITLDGKVHNMQNGAGSPELVIQQCAGRLDANGKEIYEGDILKCPAEQMCRNNTPINYTRDYFAEVKFEGVSFSLDEINNGAKYKTPVFWNGTEIVGTIFQNPQLLQN
jgi:uncharacterized phage protein (TIGR01671 family)